MMGQTTKSKTKPTQSIIPPTAPRETITGCVLITVGRNVGVGDPLVGERVGTVGVFVGVFVGGVGVNVGCFVGDRVGVVVGSCVGVRVGDLEGIRVGGVGVPVVGLGVGTTSVAHKMECISLHCN